MREKERV